MASVFDDLAADWDGNPQRVRLAGDVVRAVIATARPDAGTDALDFGCGTGLVTLGLQPLVRSITGVDSSAGMLAGLEAKAAARGLANVAWRHVDVDAGDAIPGRYHLVVCSMALHHVQGVPAALAAWRAVLLPGGQVCVADLDPEDGSFHGDMAGVHHRGFDRGWLGDRLGEAGFTAATFTTVSAVERPAADGGVRRFPVFLVHARG